MAVELDHPFTMSGSADENLATVTNLEKVVPCVEGGSVTEVVGPESVKAEILMKMGAMSMKLIGTVEVVEKDEAAHTALVRVKSRESGGTGHANADVTYTAADGGGTIHTRAQITGKAASMGEGVVVGVLDALIKDFTGKLSAL
jgi:carbon monoxide dehydrogenase subunit G